MAPLDDDTLSRLLAHEEPIRGPLQQLLRAGNEREFWEVVIDGVVAAVRSLMRRRCRRCTGFWFEGDVGPAFGVVGNGGRDCG